MRSPFVALALAAGLVFVASEPALQIAVRIMIARSEGRLEVDGASGSLLSDVRVKRLVWRGPGATMTADEVAINWNPRALWSRGIVVKGLGAQRITLAIQPSDSAVPPPPTLALPTDVAIDEVAVADFEWTIGTNSGTHHRRDVRRTPAVPRRIASSGSRSCSRAARSPAKRGDRRAARRSP